ncbi:MAG: rane attack complex component/perforin/complement [Herbinix sp.]|jgi:hypothetical protein|nr:rane attack complex component/perforin/complement [Herbinix sp.]MDF2845315.1 rane attack complex component/perforin/complement [Herbinix sp.]
MANNNVDNNEYISCTATLGVPIPGLDSLGKGYNVFDLYADPKSTTIDLFELGEQEQVSVLRKDYYKPKTVNVQEILQGNFYSYNDLTISGYLNKLKTSTSLEGEYNFFTGSLNVDFEKTEIENREHEYTKVTDCIQKLKLNLAASNNDSLIQLLKNHVKSDINTLPPLELFKKYGTHFLKEIIVGAKCEFFSATNQVEFHREINIKTIAELSYKRAIYKISASEEAQYGSIINEFYKYSVTKLNVYGGKPEYGKYITTAGNYDKWIESIDENPVFCSFTNNSLSPIWVLCDNPSRQEELKDAFAKYAENNYSRISQNCVTCLDVIGSSNAGIAPKFGYIKINKDLNAGAGGQYIYLCYKEGLDDLNNPDKPITNIDVIIANSLNEARNQTPANHTLIEYDLNTGARGKYIYICYSKEPTYEPIRSIQIISGNSGDIPASYGYTKIEKDLNSGAGGEFIYLCYSRYF